MRRIINFFGEENIPYLFLFTLSRRGFIIVNDCTFSENDFSYFLPDNIRLTVIDSPSEELIENISGFIYEGTSDTVPEYLFIKNPPEDVLTRIIQIFPHRGWVVKSVTEYSYYGSIPVFNGRTKEFFNTEEIATALEGARSFYSKHVKNIKKDYKKFKKKVLKLAKKIAKIETEMPLSIHIILDKFKLHEEEYRFLEEVARGHYGVLIGSNRERIVVINKRKIVEKGARVFKRKIESEFEIPINTLTPENPNTRIILVWIKNALDILDEKTEYLPNDLKNFLSLLILLKIIKDNAPDTYTQWRSNNYIIRGGLH